MEYYRLRSTILGSLLAGVLYQSTAYAQGSDQPLITYDRKIAELVVTNTSPLLQVFRDGRVIVNVPFYRPNGGTYETVLSPDELRELVQQMRDAKLDSFDAGEALSSRNQLANNPSDGIVHIVSDDEISSIELELPDSALDGVLGESIEGEIPTTESNLVWTNLQDDAVHYDVPGLDKAAAAELRLRDLVNDVAGNP